MFLFYSTRVSNELGAGQPKAARLATRVIMIVSLSVCAAEGLVVLLARNIWGLAYSNNEEVIKYTVIVTPTLAAAIFLDGLQGVLSGKEEIYLFYKNIFVDLTNS